MKRVWMLLPVALLLAGAAYWYARPSAGGKAPAIQEVRRSDITIKVTEGGEVRALRSVTIAAQRDGLLTHIVPEGTPVRRGDVVVQFDPGQYETALQASRVELQVAQAELQKAERDLEVQAQRIEAEISRLRSEVQLTQLELTELQRKPLRADVEKAQLELEKARAAFDTAAKKRSVLPELVRKGFVTQGALDEAELAYLSAKAGLQAAQVTFDTVSAGARPDELEKATIKLTQARSALERAESSQRPQLAAAQAEVTRVRANVGRAQALIERARADLEGTKLRAPQDGLVVYGDRTAIRPGTNAYRGQILIQLPDVSTMVVDTTVNEIDVGKVKVGQPTEVRLEAFPGAVFKGQVLQIGSLARLKRSQAGGVQAVKVFDVTVNVEDRDPRLRPGLTATVDLIIDRQVGVLTVPLAAVVSREGGPVVFVLSSAGRIETRPVVLGPSSEQAVVVRSGVREGERVLLGPPPSDS